MENTINAVYLILDFNTGAKNTEFKFLVDVEEATDIIIYIISILPHSKESSFEIKREYKGLVDPSLLCNKEIIREKINKELNIDSMSLQLEKRNK